jgi:hypothetical protein
VSTAADVPGRPVRSLLQFRLRGLLLFTLLAAAFMGALTQVSVAAAVLCLALLPLLLLPTGHLLWDLCFGVHALGFALGWLALADRDVFRHVFLANLLAVPAFSLCLAAWAARSGQRRLSFLALALAANAFLLGWADWMYADALPFASNT